MALRHSRSGEPISLRPAAKGSAAARSTALFKARQLEVMRLVLPAGASLPPHAVPGEITVQCLEGRIEMRCGNQPRRLDAGQMLWLEGGVLHDVRALDDAVVLVTVVLAPVVPSPVVPAP